MMNIVKKPAAAVVIVAILGILAAGRSLASLRIGDSPPRIALTDLTGSTVSIPDNVIGKVTVIHFWTSGCGSCREEMQTLDGLYRSYGRKGLAILAVNIGDQRKQIRETLAGLPLTFPVLMDPERKSVRPYNVTGVPRTIIIDRNGTIRYKIIGSTSRETLTKYITSLLDR